MKNNVVSLNMAEAAVMCGVTYARIQQMLKDDDPPPREDDKTFRTDTLGEWMRRRAVRLAMEKPTSLPSDILDAAGMLNPIQERARKDKELADKAALENQLRRGELIETSIIGDKWSEILMRVRSRMLRLPWSLSPLLIGVDDVVKIQITIEEQIRDALTELATE